MVLLRPAPGALPDPDPSNDAKILTFDGSLSGWNRGIDSVLVTPNGDGTADVQVHGNLTVSNIGSSGDDGVDLSQELVIVDDFGTELHSEALSVLFHDPPATTKISACALGCATAVCGEWSGNPWLTLAAQCLPSEFLYGNCGCSGETDIVIPAVPEPPIGGLTVHLRPAPGALPELPGFPEDDDERRPDRNTAVGGEIGTARAVVELKNHPNPFNPTTVLSFELSDGGTGELAIFDARGGRIRTLHRGLLAAGTHEFRWRGDDDAGSAVASGAYFVQLQMGDQSYGRRVTLLK